MKENDRVITDAPGAYFLYNIPPNSKGTVVKSYNGIYTDPSRKLLAVEWDNIGLRGCDKKFLTKLA